MERNQGFFSSLKKGVLRSMSPTWSKAEKPVMRSGSSGSGLLQRKKRVEDYHADEPGALMATSGSLRWLGDALSPLMDGPDPNDGRVTRDSKRFGSGIKRCMKKGQLFGASSLSSSSFLTLKRSDTRLLLSVMAAPLAPVHVNNTDPLPELCIMDTAIETLAAQYIVLQYTAASGAEKLQNSIHSSYAVGKVSMSACEFGTATRVLANQNGSAESGGFVLWQMDPNMWFIDLVVGGSKVHAGCNGTLVWRHTPWLGAHAAKGPIRPLRRALQGLDPRTIAGIFAKSRCVGEKRTNGHDCFVLKVCAGCDVLKARSEGATEIVRHVLFGYFSQRTGLLIRIDDSHLTRTQSKGGDAVYWETTASSFLDDYRGVEGAMVAHSGRSVVTIFRFCDVAMNHTKVRMEEAWSIEEVAFNVPDLGVDCFVPPLRLICEEGMAD